MCLRGEKGGSVRNLNGEVHPGVEQTMDPIGAAKGTLLISWEKKLIFSPIIKIALLHIKVQIRLSLTVKILSTHA